MFRSISTALFLDQGCHRELRNICVAHLKNSEEKLGVYFIEEDFRYHCRKMAQDRQWTGEEELWTLANLFGKKIYLYPDPQRGVLRADQRSVIDQR